MSRPNNGWGSPSYSQDLVDNYFKTHHDEDGSMVLNDEDYLNGLYEDDLSPSDAVVRMSNHYLAYDDNYIDSSLDDDNETSDEDLDYGFEKDEDGFYIIPDNDEVFEFMYDGHGNYLDDEFDDEEIF